MKLKTENRKINGSLKKINTIEKPRASLTKKKKEDKLPTPEIKEICTDFTDIKRAVKNYYKQLYAHN